MAWPVLSSGWSVALAAAVSAAVTPVPRVVFKPGMAVSLQKESPLQMQELRVPECPGCLLHAPRRGQLCAFSYYVQLGTFDNWCWSLNHHRYAYGSSSLWPQDYPRPTPHTRSEDKHVQATAIHGDTPVISSPLLHLRCAQQQAALLLLAQLVEFYLSMIHSIPPTPSHSVEAKWCLKSPVFTSLFLRLVVHLYSPLQIL